MAAITQIRSFGAHTGRRYGSFAGKETPGQVTSAAVYWRSPMDLADWASESDRADWRSENDLADWSDQ